MRTATRRAAPRHPATHSVPGCPTAAERLEPRRLLADAVALFSFDPALQDVPEDAGAATVTIRRGGDTTTAVDVTYKIFGAPTFLGGATPGDDFDDVSGTVSFAPGETAKTVTLPIADDALAEGNEFVRINFIAVSGAPGRGESPYQARITILDNDSPGVLALAQQEFRVDEGAGAATITVTRGGTLRGEVSVNYAAAAPPMVAAAIYPPPPGFAEAGTDFEPVSGTLTFADGQASATFTVPVVQDAVDEPDERFAVYLTQPGGGATLASPADSESHVVILDDDAAPPPVDPDAPVPTVEGTAGPDRILLLARPDRQVAVFVNGASRGAFDATNGLRVNGGGGNDVIHAGRAGAPVILDGGPGHDALTGGPLADLLIGGDGNDRAFGGPGHDMLIGGGGADRLGGGGSDDLLVAGTTDFDAATGAGTAALRSLLARWSSADDYAARVAAVTTAGPAPATGAVAIINADTAHTDTSLDILTGHVGQDLFLADARRPHFRDLLPGRGTNETLVEL